MENWILGLVLIVITIAFHAISTATIALLQRNFWNFLEKHSKRLRHAVRNWVIMSASVGLLLAIVHGAEIILWAEAYSCVDAMRSFSDAVFYSMDSMTTRGASGLEMQPHWRLMGALEGIDGMLLFGISTAFIFAMMQNYWQKLMSNRPHD